MSDTTGDTFMQALTDPRLDALLGMTQGFAQAAMPTRMPTPFGAVLGMGAGGAMQGVKQGQALAMGAQQLQQAQIANQRAGMLMDAYKQMYGGGGAPFGAPVAGAGQSPLPGAASSGQPGYLTSPQQLKMLADLAMATGQDRAAATLYGMPNTMAGGAGYSMGANGQAFPTPGGAADPRMVAAIQAAKTFAEKNTAAPYEQPVSVDVPQLGPDGQPTGNVVKQQIPLPRWAAQNGSPAGGGAPLQPNALPADPFPGWAKQINAGESGGDPNAANPNSTASGPGQFLNGTWPSVLRATRPDIAAGHTDAELMPLRNIPALADSATEAYARMNGGILAQKGLPVDGSTVALAHAFGPGGASTILQAQPNAPLAMLPGMAPVIAANPQLKGMTAGQVTQMYQARMGGGQQPPQYGGQVTLSPQNQAALKIQEAQSTPYDARPGSIHVVPPNQVAPGGGTLPTDGAPTINQAAPGVHVTSQPNGSSVTTNSRPLMDEQYKNDIKAADAATDDINGSQNQLVRLQAMKQAAANIPTGSGGNQRLAISNFVQTYMPALSNTWATRAAQLPDAALGQEFSKLALTSAGEQEKGVLGGRGGYRAIELYKSANPNLDLQPNANQQIINMQMVAHQADIDYGRGLQNWVNQHGNAYVQGQSDYKPSSEYDEQWTNQNNPQVYSAAISAMNGTPFSAWSKNLANKDEGLRTMQIIARIDPNATVMDERGKPMPVSAFLPQQASN